MATRDDFLLREFSWNNFVFNDLIECFMSSFSFLVTCRSESRLVIDTALNSVRRTLLVSLYFVCLVYFQRQFPVVCLFLVYVPACLFTHSPIASFKCLLVCSSIRLFVYLFVSLLFRLCRVILGYFAQTGSISIIVQTVFYVFTVTMHKLGPKMEMGSFCDSCGRLTPVQFL